MLKIAREDVSGKQLRVINVERGSIRAPAYDMVRNRVLNNVPNQFNERRYDIFLH